MKLNFYGVGQSGMKIKANNDILLNHYIAHLYINECSTIEAFQKISSTKCLPAS